MPVVAAVSHSESWKQPNKHTNKQHFKVFLLLIVCRVMVSLLPLSFWPFASCLYLIQQRLNIACIWYSEPQCRISDLFGLLSIISLHCPSTHHLLAFHLLLVFDSASLNLFLIYLIYSLLSLSSSFYPSSFCPFALLVFDTAISLSWAPTQLAWLWNTLCLLSICALVATVFCSSFEQDHPRIFLDCSIPPNLF